MGHRGCTQTEQCYMTLINKNKLLYTPKNCVYSLSERSWDAFFKTVYVLLVPSNLSLIMNNKGVCRTSLATPGL